MLVRGTTLISTKNHTKVIIGIECVNEGRFCKYFRRKQTLFPDCASKHHNNRDFSRRPPPETFNLSGCFLLDLIITTPPAVLARLARAVTQSAKSHGGGGGGGRDGQTVSSTCT